MNFKYIVNKISDSFLRDDSNMKLSVAESLTSGLIQSIIGNISGASKFYYGGITTYSINSKINILNVDEKNANINFAVSEIVAKEMAKGVIELFNTNIGISTTGFAEKFTARTNDKEFIYQPEAYIGICIKRDNGNLINNSLYVSTLELNDYTRNEVRELVAKKSLEFLIENISDYLSK